MSPGDLLRPEAAADTVAPTDLVPDLNGLTPDTSDIDVSAGSDVSEDLGGEGPDLASDVPPDVDKGDVGQDLPPDLSKPDVMQAACAAATPVTGGNMIFNTTNALCFVTCDDMQFGWGCSSFNQTAKVDRTVKVNGTNVTCGGTLPAKRQPGNYYYFEVGAGGHTWDLIHWSGSFNSSCPAPTGGFAP